MGAVVGHGKGLGRAFPLVVDRPRSDRVDVAPIGFRLRMDLGIAVDLRGRGEQEDRLLGAGEAEHVVGAQGADFERRNRVIGVIDGRCGRGKVQDGIDGAVEIERFADIVLNRLEGAVAAQLSDIGRHPGDKVIDADHPPAVADQPVTGVQYDGGTGDLYASTDFGVRFS